MFDCFENEQLAEHAQVFVSAGGVRRLLKLMNPPHMTAHELATSPALNTVSSIAHQLFVSF